MSKLSKTTRHQLAWFVLIFLVALGLTLVSFPFALANTAWWLNFKQASLKLTQPVFAPLNLLNYRLGQDLELKKLAQAYLTSQAKLSQLEKLKKENQALKKLLEVKDRPEGEVVAAPIVSRAQPLVAAGEEAGIKPGSLVFVNDVFVGVVDQVWSQTASVKLLAQDPELKLLAKTKSGVSGLVRSKNGRLFLTEVPANLEIKRYDPVFTSGQPQVPVGLLVGLVAQSPEVTAQPTFTVPLDQGVDFYQAEVVTIRP